MLIINNIRALRCKIYFLMKPDMQVEAGTNNYKFFLQEKKSFDRALNFNQVDLPYPVQNQVNIQFRHTILLHILSPLSYANFTCHIL